MTDKLILPEVVGRRTDRQAYAVELINSGHTVEDAMAEAGYVAGYTTASFLSSASVQAALKIGRSVHIQTALASKALKRMETLIDSPTGTVAFAAAKWALEAAGHGLKGGEDAKDKPLHEMTPEQLRGFIETQQQLIAEGGSPPIITITPDTGAE